MRIVLAAPAVPFVLLARIWQTIPRSPGGGGRRRFFRAGPLPRGPAYFAEYGFFGGNQGARPSNPPPLVTGANVAYHQTVAGVARWATERSWENVIHDQLYAQGSRLGLVPAARVRQNQTYRLGAFCRGRFEHGRDFAATRASKLPAWHRAALCVGTPALPAGLAARIARSVTGNLWPEP